MHSVRVVRFHAFAAVAAAIFSSFSTSALAADPVPREQPVASQVESPIAQTRFGPYLAIGGGATFENFDAASSPISPVRFPSTHDITSGVLDLRAGYRLNRYV